MQFNEMFEAYKKMHWLRILVGLAIFLLIAAPLGLLDAGNFKNRKPEIEAIRKNGIICSRVVGYSSFQCRPDYSKPQIAV